MTQLDLGNIGAGSAAPRSCTPLRTQLLKWVGNKQRFAHEIVGSFAPAFGTYFEPFLGSGAVLGTLAPRRAVASDALKPLIELWQALVFRPEDLKNWYAERWHRMSSEGKVAAYEAIKASYNRSPNPADLVFISRSCYGGVVRFRRRDGGISTPCGVHDPVDPASFSRRVDLWWSRVNEAQFVHSDFESIMDSAKRGDLVYCDPPYTHTQAILYGAQAFELSRLLTCIERCKARGVFVVLSIDGTKKSGTMLCDVHIPDGLFEREALINCGRSMLRRFQMKGESLESEHVRDRLLLTY
ncbi:MAG TPA: DNA adenine methylase [Gemmatimonadales bacterium]